MGFFLRLNSNVRSWTPGSRKTLHFLSVNPCSSELFLGEFHTSFPFSNVLIQQWIHFFLWNTFENICQENILQFQISQYIQIPFIQKENIEEFKKNKSSWKNKMKWAEGSWKGGTDRTEHAHWTRSHPTVGWIVFYIYLQPNRFFFVRAHTHTHTQPSINMDHNGWFVQTQRRTSYSVIMARKHKIIMITFRRQINSRIWTMLDLLNIGSSMYMHLLWWRKYKYRPAGGIV